ncbi:MAG: anthranilate synthase component I family protein [Deltaproteobacteria bacterium]|jgi:anthranilate synthase component 1|nr:anthranilate synthase component I family protein [Deltaproteobacteria bacterium]
MITVKQKAIFLDSDVATPISLFLSRIGESEAGVLLESAEVGGRWGRYSLICQGLLIKLTCRQGLLDVETADFRFEPLTKFSGLPYLQGLKQLMRELTVLPDPAFESLPPITRAFYGYLGYGLVSEIEPCLSPWINPKNSEAVMGLPAKVFLFDHAYNRLVEISLGGTALPLKVEPKESVGPEGLTVMPDKAAYLEIVRQGREEVARGELIQLVPSMGFEKPFSGSPFAVYRRLRRLNPSPYMFYLQLPEISLICSSPEVLVSCDKNRLKLCPIAGTRPRGQDRVEDDLFEAELTADPKEISEHVMLVDLGRNDLGRVAASGSVKVERFMEVERFSHVMHLTSHLGANLAEGKEAVDVIGAAFPAGTLSGAPKIKAMELIARYEGIDRGPYGGAIGWLGLDKDKVNLDLGIAIRSLWVRDGRAYWRAGGGVVYDSEPQREWRECLNKAAAIVSALEGQSKEAGNVFNN